MNLYRILLFIIILPALQQARAQDSLVFQEARLFFPGFPIDSSRAYVEAYCKQNDYAVTAGTVGSARGPLPEITYSRHDMSLPVFREKDRDIREKDRPADTRLSVNMFRDADSSGKILDIALSLAYKGRSGRAITDYNVLRRNMKRLTPLYQERDLVKDGVAFGKYAAVDGHRRDTAPRLIATLSYPKGKQSDTTRLTIICFW